MKIFDLIKRDIRYFRGVNLALLAGVIVATAVLTGALLVGDSVRGSLARLARDRLGKIDDAILARRFFDASLVDRLAADEKLKSRFTFAPAATLTGGGFSCIRRVNCFRFGDIPSRSRTHVPRDQALHAQKQADRLAEKRRADQGAGGA